MVIIMIISSRLIADYFAKYLDIISLIIIIVNMQIFGSDSGKCHNVCCVELVLVSTDEDLRM